MHSLRLTPHPSTPCPWVESLDVELQYTGGRLSLRYRVNGAVERLRIPPERTPTRSDELWRHTCFEAFIKPRQSTGYLELNFAPSGAWAAYRFDGYRSGMMNADEMPVPQSTCTMSSSRLEVAVSIHVPEVAGARLAICAVIEDDSGQVSYWALVHPPGRPDFHHDAGFALHCPAA